jgi:hypothetical protein
MNGLLSDSNLDIYSLNKLQYPNNKSIHDLLCIVIDINLRHISRKKDGREIKLLEVSVIDNSVDSDIAQNTLQVFFGCTSQFIYCEFALLYLLYFIGMLIFFTYDFLAVSHFSCR